MEMVIPWQIVLVSTATSLTGNRAHCITSPNNGINRVYSHGARAASVKHKC